MIRNVFGKAVTKSTALSLLEYKNKDESAISSVDLAKVALALKNSQGKGKDEEEVLRSVQIVREICGRKQEEEFCTLGWIYNATGSAITLLDTHNGRGKLAASTLYPVRIENGQWGMFLHEQSCLESSGAVVYEGYNSDYLQICYWCVAWKNRSMSSSPQVPILSHSLFLAPYFLPHYPPIFTSLFHFGFLTTQLSILNHEFTIYNNLTVE